MNEMYEERFRKNGCLMVLTAFAEISGRRPDASLMKMYNMCARFAHTIWVTHVLYSGNMFKNK